MTDSTQSDLIHKVGGMILDDPTIADADWEALAVLVTAQEEAADMIGFRYLADGETPSIALDNFGEITMTLLELREVMAAAGAGEWMSCLIHIKKPDFGMHIQFEDEDAARWQQDYMTQNIDEYALSLKPA
jgi:hypothetical protein